MDDIERDELFKRAKAKRDRAVSAADEELNRAIKSIELVYDLSHDDTDDSANGAHAGFVQVLRDRVPLPADDADSQGGPASRVRQIISDMPEFSTTTIVEASSELDGINALEPKQVSSVMNRFAKTGEIVLVREGSGREPHTYRKGADGLAITVKPTNLSHTESETVA